VEQSSATENFGVDNITLKTFFQKPSVRNVVMKYVKYNLFGVLVFFVSSFVYWSFGSGGWIAFIMAGGIGGLVEFTLQLYFVYGNSKFFGRINQRLKFLDEWFSGN